MSEQEVKPDMLPGFPPDPEPEVIPHEWQRVNSRRVVLAYHIEGVGSRGETVVLPFSQAMNLVHAGRARWAEKEE